MENASKALLIAAGMFLAVLILSLLVFSYNRISEYYEQQHEFTVIEQAQEFNARFENYNRNDIRGSDLISLMNRVIDYNATQSYFEGTNYERIKVTITLGRKEIRNQFKYETEDDVTSQNKYLNEETITNKNGSGADWENDKQLTAITNTSTYLCKQANDIYDIDNLTDTKLQQLASNIANMVVDETDKQSSSAAYARFKRADVIEDILGLKVGSSSDCDIKIDEVTGITNSSDLGYDKLMGIKDIVSQYYQYMQFKRAYFDCTEMKYDPDTNRVVEIKFKLQTKLVNGVETVVFN